MTPQTCLRQLGFQAYGNCRERSSSPFRIMQIVTSQLEISAHAWSLVFCVKFPVKQGIGVRLGQPRGLLWLHMRGGTPSEAGDE